MSTVNRWLLKSFLLTNMSWSRPHSPSSSWRGNLRTCAGRWDTVSHNYLIFLHAIFHSPQTAVCVKLSFMVNRYHGVKRAERNSGCLAFPYLLECIKHNTNYMSSPAFSNWLSCSLNEILLWSFWDSKVLGP